MSVAALFGTVTACAKAIALASLHASLIILLVFLMQWAFKKWLTPGLRHALWLLVVLRLIVPLVPSSSWSVFNLFARDSQPPPPPPARLALPSVASLPVTQAPLPARSPALLSKSSSRFLFPWDWAAGAWLTGVLIVLMLVWRRHRHIGALVQASLPVKDASHLALLAACRETLRLRAPIRLLESNLLPTPAIFGVRQPCLLLPVSLRQSLDRDELRLVFLHELTHIKRFDLLLDWLWIGIQAVHWFNPLVWFASQRFRADRELACDASVLRRLGAEERQQYGRILIKLVEQFSPAPLAPGLLSIIHTETEIKRRIVMISKFKPTSRSVTLLGALLLAFLGLFTLTRAADKATAPPSIQPPRAETAPARNEDHGERGIQMIQDELDRNQREIADRQGRMDALKREWGITEQESQKSGEGTGTTLRRLEELRIDARAEYERLSTLYNQLTKLPRAELKATIATTAPDPVLTSLMQKEAEVEQKGAELSATFDEKAPAVQANRKVQETIDRQINDRLAGILSGFNTRVAADKQRLETLQMEMEEYQARDIAQSIQRRPYFQAKRDVENLQFIRDRLQARLYQERADRAANLANAPTPSSPNALDSLLVQTVEINASGKYVFSGRIVSLDQLTRELKQAQTRNSGLQLHLRTSSGTRTEVVRALLDRCIQLDIDNVSLGTKQ